MSDCLFCRIVAGEIDAKRIYEDDHAVAFLDISPWQDGHTLVIPRRHVADVLEDEDVLGEVAHATARVGRMLQVALGASACNIVSNAGADAGQEVFHAHVHVVPRYAHAPGLANLKGEPSLDLDEVHARVTAQQN